MTQRAGSQNELGYSWEIALLGGFSVRRDNQQVEFSPTISRLVAFLALNPARVTRSRLAGVLWIDGSQKQAFANLRSTLWRLRRGARTLVTTDSQFIGLASTVSVDVISAMAVAERLDALPRTAHELRRAREYFTKELLPGWSDEWAVMERERHRQRSLHALESMAMNLALAGHHGQAIDIALMAIELDPLRESAHRTVIQIHLGEGNHSEALRCHDRYKALIEAELGITPSPLLDESIVDVAS